MKRTMYLIACVCTAAVGVGMIVQGMGDWFWPTLTAIAWAVAASEVRQ
jgi:hypothetical protein